jgi:hypothetical protein
MAFAIVILLVLAGERGRDDVRHIDITVGRGVAVCVAAGENDRYCLSAGKLVDERTQELVG